MGSTVSIDSARQMMEVLSGKVGTVALVVGLLHYGNVWFLNAFRRRAAARAPHSTAQSATGFTGS